MDYLRAYMLIKEIYGEDVGGLVAKMYLSLQPAVFILPRYHMDKFIVAGSPDTLREDIEKYFWLTHLHNWPARASKLLTGGKITPRAHRRFEVVYGGWTNGTHKEYCALFTMHAKHHTRMFLAGFYTIDVFLERLGRSCNLSNLCGDLGQYASACPPGLAAKIKQALPAIRAAIQ